MSSKGINMSIQKMSISVALCAAAVLINSPLFAGDKDVNVVNTPDVNVANMPDVNVANTPDVNVANMPDVNIANTVGNPVPVSVVETGGGTIPYQERFQIQMAPLGSRLIGTLDIDQTIPPNMILKVKAVNFGSASSSTSTDVSIEVKLQNMLPLERQTFISNLSEPNAAGILVRGHYLTEFLIGREQSDIHDNIEVAIQNVTLVDTVMEITLTGELFAKL